MFAAPFVHELLPWLLVLGTCADPLSFVWLHSGAVQCFASHAKDHVLMMEAFCFVAVFSKHALRKVVGADA